jgi:hypothetical protein
VIEADYEGTVKRTGKYLRSIAYLDGELATPYEQVEEFNARARQRIDAYLSRQPEGR